jgi:hypothetical protein
MSMHADVETLARALAQQVLKASDWPERLDAICQDMQDAARKPGNMRDVAERAEAILRHIAQSDAMTIGRLYFDLLPRDPANPLSAAVMAAFSDGNAVIRMLRESGLRLDMQKDDVGENFIIIHDLEQAEGLGDGLKLAILRALSLTAQLASPPQGVLHYVH